ncbi:MAG: lycopene cyclase domain-containing protein [Anaerolineae bacterium]
MTYFGVLATFILPPIVLMGVLVPLREWCALLRGESAQIRWEPFVILGIHVLMALFYTTPWDNYLVATGVWWYDENLVTGITLGYVPIEEYTFFIVQTIMTGLWTIGLMRTVTPTRESIPVRPRLRLGLTAAVVIGWAVSTAVLLSGWVPGTYLTLILSWALIPVFVQIVFGGDILVANWRLLVLSIGVPTLYLWVVDYLAINSGTWTIDPIQTTGVKVGVLPLEEMVFFLMTIVLIGFGMTLMLSPVAKRRAQALVARFKNTEDGHAVAK